MSNTNICLNPLTFTIRTPMLKRIGHLLRITGEIASLCRLISPTIPSSGFKRSYKINYVILFLITYHEKVVRIYCNHLQPENWKICSLKIIFFTIVSQRVPHVLQVSRNTVLLQMFHPSVASIVPQLEQNLSPLLTEFVT